MRPSQLENALLQPAHLEAHRLLEALSDARWWALVLGVGLAPLSNFTSFLCWEAGLFPLTSCSSASRDPFLPCDDQGVVLADVCG